MKYLPNKKAFLGIDNKINIKEKVVVVPFGLEKTVSYGSGTNKGPREIIKASHQVELFDEDLNKEPYKNIGIKTLKPFPIKKDIIDALKQIENINKLLIEKEKFPLILGGEHSLTPGAIRPFIKKFGKICLLHFDAHADLRNSYNNNKFSHASAIRRCLDNPNVSVISFGVRNISSNEIHFLEKKFSFKNFSESQKFVNQVGDIAEKEGHHPDIIFGWGHATVQIFTHKIKGLVENDFILAAKINKI